MKVLHFALLAPGSPQWGLRHALRELAGPDGEYREYDWFPRWRMDQLSDLRMEFIAEVRDMKPDLVFCQIQTDRILPAPVLEQVRDASGFVMSWCGDLRDQTPAWAIEAAPHLDLHCFSNMRDVENIRGMGYPAEFLNIGFSGCTFIPDGPLRHKTPEIVFLGTNYANRFPCSAQRQRIVAAMRARYGSRFAVHGHGWGDSDVFLDEQEEAEAYRTCKIALDINHYQTVARFTSDRRLRAMASGAFVLANWHPGIEDDFEVGKHLAAWKHESEIPGLIDRYLRDVEERKQIAAAGCDHVRRNHDWNARMRDVREFIGRYSRVKA